MRVIYEKDTNLSKVSLLIEIFTKKASFKKVKRRSGL